MIKFIYYLFISVIEVHLTLFMSKSGNRKKREKKLVNAIKNAGKNVKYYGEKWEEANIDLNSIKSFKDLKKLPFITKEEIRTQFPDGIVAEGLDINKCYYSATTGSTGKSLSFVYSIFTFAFYLATNLRVYTMTGYKPWYKCSYIKYTPVESIRIGPFFRYNHVPSVASLSEQIKLLKKQKPDYLDGYASIIFEIAKTVSKEDLKLIKPKIILLNSEMSTDAQRDFISEVFNCPVYDEYSTEETWMIASQCKHHNYHVFTDNVWVEIVDENGNDVPDGEKGEIILTTLRSPAMPFIRYRIGDIGSFSTAPCKCGSPFPVLKSFEGRRDDSFILPDGTFISSLKVLNTFTIFINKHLHLMEEFKVVQLEKDHVNIQLVKGKSFIKEQFEEVLNALGKLLGDEVNISVDFKKQINNDGKIKRKAIESKVFA